MTITNIKLKNLYEVLIMDFEYENFEYIKSYVIFFASQTPQLFIKDIEELGAADELDEYLDSKNKELIYLVNSNPVSNDTYFYEEVFVNKDAAFITFVQKHSDKEELELFIKENTEVTSTLIENTEHYNIPF